MGKMMKDGYCQRWYFMVFDPLAHDCFWGHAGHGFIKSTNPGFFANKQHT
jgi:hypothetical protein